MNARVKELVARDPTFRQKLLAVLAAASLLTGSLLFARSLAPQPRPVLHPLERPCLIIDPGHGGVDGGAVAYNGIRESDLNLSISLKLRDLADFFGCACVMTRSEDVTRSDGDRYSEHRDLECRAEQVNQVGNGVLISIHQNTFPTSQPTGAQILYGPGQESRRLGEMAHSALISALQPENRRVAAPAPAELYLTSHVNCPAILVECGFLSNLSDLQKLCDDCYQSSLASVLISSFLQYSAQPSI